MTETRRVDAYRPDIDGLRAVAVVSPMTRGDA